MGAGEEEEEGFISDSSTATAVPPGVGGAVRSRRSGDLIGVWLMVFLGEIHLIPLELSGEGRGELQLLQVSLSFLYPEESVEAQRA